MEAKKKHKDKKIYLVMRQRLSFDDPEFASKSIAGQPMEYMVSFTKKKDAELFISKYLGDYGISSPIVYWKDDDICMIQQDEERVIRFFVKKDKVIEDFYSSGIL